MLLDLIIYLKYVTNGQWKIHINNFDPHSVYLVLGHNNHFIAIEMVF